MTVRIDADLLLPGRGEPITNGTVIAEGDTIIYAGATAEAPEVHSVSVTHVPVVMPGLWDCHSHYGTDTPEELAKTGMPTPPVLGARAVSELGRPLDGGVTSVRAVG